MRRLIIDTDTGSDDAVALIMALMSPDVHVEAITTVCGNVPLELATKNALSTILATGTYQPPVYEGAKKPLFRELRTATNVHGEDGMGEMNLPEPSIKPLATPAAVAIVELAKKYPGEIELVALGPATNIAVALFLDPDAMQGIKRIYSMGTGGFALGNATPVAEFNVWVDAESYDAMLRSGIPVTVIGFDMCIGEAALLADEIDAIEQSGSPVGYFAMRCNYSLIDYNVRRSNKKFLDLPDPIAMAAVVWPELVLDAPLCYCYTCVKEEMTYGQVIVDDGSVRASGLAYCGCEPNATVVRSMDFAGFKRRLHELLTRPS